MRFLSEDLVRFFLRGPGMEIILAKVLSSCGDPSEMASEVLA